MTTMIEISQLSKAYKKEEIVSKVNMNIKKGEIYGFLGQNGAGKTTIMKIILNLIKPTNGEIRVKNELIKKGSYKYLKNIGNIIETPVFYNKLSAKENLALHAEYIGGQSTSRIQEVLCIVGLESVGDKLVTEYSLGMRQRLGIARAILTNPEILILDEPINGLDPIGIKETRELLVKLKKKYKMTILISSHIVSEIECIADTIGVIDNGKILKEVQLSEIRTYGNSQLILEVDNPIQAQNVLEMELGFVKVERLGNSLCVYDQGVDQSLVMRALINSDIIIAKIEQRQESLEEYFLNMINRGK